MTNIPDYPATCVNQCPEAPLGRVEVYEDLTTRLFHFQAREVGVKNQKANPALCGVEILDMRKAAWFDVGDKRGRAHFDRACEDCRKGLVY